MQKCRINGKNYLPLMPGFTQTFGLIKNKNVMKNNIFFIVSQFSVLKWRFFQNFNVFLKDDLIPCINWLLVMINARATIYLRNNVRMFVQLFYVWTTWPIWTIDTSFEKSLAVNIGCVSLQCITEININTVVHL